MFCNFKYVILMRVFKNFRRFRQTFSLQHREGSAVYNIYVKMIRQCIHFIVYIGIFNWTLCRICPNKKCTFAIKLFFDETDIFDCQDCTFQCLLYATSRV